ncbi:YraN family protein [Kitasatospora sp. NPDC002040]|uniref:YraN family protein n=1 Tax=Kitasatospora sp. NPDC002040 TaxID=3154661 RepID=UPI0033305CF8
MQSSNNGLGRYGEEVAVRWLTEGGLRILERNWRCAEGELDIIALDGDTIAVCEVKTRSERGFQHPNEGIDQTKAERLRHLAERWLGERWPEHFARLADSVQPPGDRSAQPEPSVPEAGPEAPEAEPGKAEPGKGGRAAKPTVRRTLPVPALPPVPLPPGGVRIDLVAVVNRLKGAALVEHLRGAV